MAILHWRHLWRNTGNGTFTIFWPDIKHDSYVLVTAAEARVSELVPDRFVGEADIEVTNIVPQDGLLQFVMGWKLRVYSLNIWTDITVFDPNDPVA